jgi:hypothetical protein
LRWIRWGSSPCFCTTEIILNPFILSLNLFCLVIWVRSARQHSIEKLRTDFLHPASLEDATLVFFF